MYVTIEPRNDRICPVSWMRSHTLCLLAANIASADDRFVALRPKSTAMVIAGRSVHLNTLTMYVRDHRATKRQSLSPFMDEKSNPASGEYYVCR